MRHRILIWLLAAAACLQAYGAMEVRYKRMTSSEGLPSNSIRNMYQDSKGFIWLGTLNGLSRYDGHSLVNLHARKQEGGRLSLVDNRINQLFEDHDGFLWVGSSARRFSCYDLQRDRFVDYTGCGEHDAVHGYGAVMPNGDVWLWSARNGTRRIVHKEGRSFASQVYGTAAGNLPDDHILFVKGDGEGNAWVGTQHGLALVGSTGRSEVLAGQGAFRYATLQGKDWFFATDEGDIYTYRAGTGKLAQVARLAQGGITSATDELEKGRWVVFTTGDALLFDFASAQFSPYARVPLKNGIVKQEETGSKHILLVYDLTGTVYLCFPQTGRTKVLQLLPEAERKVFPREPYNFVYDEHGVVWIATYGNGLFAYDTLDDSLEHFGSGADATNPIGSDYLLEIMKDRTGGIWVSAEYAGLSRVWVSNRGIRRVYPASPSVFDRSNAVRMLALSRTGDLHVGSRAGGLCVYDPGYRLLSSQQGLPANAYAYVEDAHGVPWIGTRGQGLLVGGKRYVHVPSDSTSLAYDHIFSLCCDSKGRIWVGTFDKGLDLALPTSDGRYTFRHFFQDRQGVNQVRAIAEDKHGMLWLATSDGLLVVHPDSLIAGGEGCQHVFSHQEGRFAASVVRCLLSDSEGRIWAGTSGDGLVLCRPTPGYDRLDYQVYTSADGLPNDAIQSLQEDRHGHIWVATEYGISRFNPQKESFENFFFSNYVLGNAYSENTSCKDSNGLLVFGTNYGMTVIDPDQVDGGTASPHVVFTNLEINGTRVTAGMDGSPLEESLAYAREVRLAHYQNSLRIDFSTFDFSDKQQANYKYWLENYDAEWSRPTKEGYATYKYLAPGTYRLHVKASNGAGVWDSEATVLTLVIAPPFWKTGWALGGYVLLLVLALYATFRIVRHTNRLRNRIQVEERLTEYKLMFFTNISHEFRTPLTLILGSLEKLHRMKGLPLDATSVVANMEKSTNRLLRLINQLLEFRKMQHNKLSLSLQEVDVIAFLRDIHASFREMAEQKGMHYRFIASTESYKMFVDTGKLDKVVYNLLSNAFKYTPAHGTVTLEVSVDAAAHILQLRVSDTGVGIPKEKQGELFSRFMQSSFSTNSIGIGLHLTHELVEVHKGTIRFSENEGGGSVFTVTLPTDAKVYAAADFLQPDNALLQDTPSASADGTSEEGWALPEPHSVPLNKRKVLVIEDDYDIRQLLCKKIGVYFEVASAEDGTSGFEKACTYDADLIVCDVLMPGMNGFEVTKKLKTSFATSHIPIILLTALDAPDKQLEGIDCGADAYIAKPFHLKYLLTRIFRLIEQREKLREKYTSEPGVVHAAMYATDRDKEFMERLDAVVSANMGNADFSIDDLVARMKMSRSILYKKVRGVTGYPPVEYLRIMRMKKAAELLLETEQRTIGEVAFLVGFNDQFYFSKCFKAQFGVSPSTYQKGGKGA